MNKITTCTLGISNVFLIKEKGIILVDTGTDADTAKYSELFSKLGITPQDIGLIVISHGHSDHFMYVHKLKELTAAPVLCHKEAVHALQTGINPKVMPRNELGKSVLEMLKKNNKGREPIKYRSVNPDLIVESIFDLRPYGVAGKVIHTCGHSDCSVTVLLDSGEAIVGDMIVASPFTGEACIAYFANNEQALLENIQLLLNNNAHTFYSGHGGPFTREEILKLV